MQRKIPTSNETFKPLKIIMKHSRVRNFLLTLLLFISSASLFGQKFEPKKRLSEADTSITSKIIGKDYQLYISFPKGYSTKDTTKYPVLFVLDGQSSFPVFKSVRESMDIDKELDSLIIVGIGSGLDFVSWGINRTYDYTPSLDTAFDRQYERDGAKQYNLDYNSVKGKIQSGGAEKFLQFITTEIIPYIDTHYKTTTDRGITGFSFGGLFTAWCFLNTKGIFNKFGINSPSLWWNNNEVLTQAESFFNKNKTWDMPSTKVFISVGEKEESKMVSGMEKFSKLLAAMKYKNVLVTTYQFLGETHSSAVSPSLKRTIAVLYGKKK
ncbi:MAG TPA: alpha/beta hydrolase-fold protein [Ferruginibacter sp.]|nr:alpha/beta hydrolase-fold protein [Ferruginibacter sp.]